MKIKSSHIEFWKIHHGLSIEHKLQISDFPNLNTFFKVRILKNKINLANLIQRQNCTFQGHIQFVLSTRSIV